MHFAFQKESSQTLEQFHIFITVPVQKINIFAPICSLHQVCCDPVIPPTAAGKSQSRAPQRLSRAVGALSLELPKAGWDGAPGSLICWGAASPWLGLELDGL